MKKLILLFTAILTALLLASTVYAADITLSSSCSLADAIIAANHDRPEGGCPAGRGADAIALTQDITLRDELPVITSAITIEGNGYTISGDNRYRIFYNDGGALTINNLTMTKGYVEGDLIRNTDENLRNATANPIGGAIVNWQGTVTISNSTFSDNLAEYRGGAIVNGQGTVTISDSTISDNLADEVGGAIYNRGELSIVNSEFRGNSAEYGGAIINLGDGELSISDSIFRGNLADVDGGAIYNSEELRISDSTFSNNLAKYRGGAIANWKELNISDSIFRDNLADRGGAIFNGNEGELRISDSSFSHNSADSYGGAIFNARKLSISASAFSHNSAGFWGGAIRNGGATLNEEELSIGNSAFSNNLAEKGGAIFNGDDGELSMVNSTFSGNSADDGGAIFNAEDGKLRMRNSIIAGRGGACYSESRIRQNISNFIQDGSCSPAFEGDPMLGELVEPEDGSPAYFPLLAGSRAIDAADDGYCPETDQIGTARPQGGGCDIGAFEYKE